MEFKKDENDPNLIHISFESEVISEDVGFAASNIDVKIEYYWNSHGRLVEFDGPNGKQVEKFHADSIKIVEILTKIKGIDDEFLSTDLYVNGEKQDILYVKSYRIVKDGLLIKAIVGEG